jgi:glucose/arabinose dehydrogenase/PKD repeat protein
VDVRGKRTDVTGLRACFALLAVLACVLLPATPAHAVITLPPDFDSQQVASFSFPTGLAVLPSGDVLVAQQTGKLFRFTNGSLAATPAIDLTDRICSNVERGLSGVAVDPGFTDQRYIYLYYTFKKNGACGTDPSDPSTQPVNRVSRFLMDGAGVLDPASETVLIDNIPSPAGNHIAGDLNFGKDGYLYVTVGDGYCDYDDDTGCGPYNAAARDHNVLLGKVLRITSDGNIPSDNPFQGANTARCNTTGRTSPGLWCRETYLWGFRNPFRFAFDPNATGTRFFVNDVGQENWEEIDAAQPGADYGWNVREGHCAVNSATDCGPQPTGMTNPIYDYSHADGCSSITAGAFVPDGSWPASYDASYLFGDFVCGKLFQLVDNGSGGYAVSEFGSGLGGIVSAKFAPYNGGQALYYLSWAYSPGLFRITYTGGGNRSPKAVLSAGPTNGSIPLEVSFDGSQSTDADGDTLHYDWDFGDGSAHALTAQAVHDYTTSGTYTAKLTVTDGNGGSDTATTRIDSGNEAPSPSITTPTSNQLFSVGQTITLTGSAYDPEDRTLPDAALTWQVVKHHASHTHPFLSPTTGNGIQISGPIPEDPAAVTNTYLEVLLTATDSKGLSTTISRDLRPHIVTLNFNTQPAGLALQLGGQALPGSIPAWEGWNLAVNAPDQTDSNGQGETFVSWSDGGAQSHVIHTPASDASYTATFTRNYARPKGATPMRLSLVPAYRQCTSANSSHGAPFAFGSCSPPRQTSGYATVGTPDANGVDAVRSVGFLKLITVVGNPSTPADEADVRIVTSISDVRNPTTGYTDYAGNLRAEVGLRITDKLNGASQTDPATGDVPLDITLSCLPTIDPGGSTCSATTTVDALMPGAVVEGRRAIWQVGQAQVFDGGPDGNVSTADNTLFATQGLFVP